MRESKTAQRLYRFRCKFRTVDFVSIRRSAYARWQRRASTKNISLWFWKHTQRICVHSTHVWWRAFSWWFFSRWFLAYSSILIHLAGTVENIISKIIPTNSHFRYSCNYSMKRSRNENAWRRYCWHFSDAEEFAAESKLTFLLNSCLRRACAYRIRRLQSRTKVVAAYTWECSASTEQFMDVLCVEHAAGKTIK